MEVTTTRNANTTTGITGVPTILDETPYVVVYEEIYSERKTDSLGDELYVHGIYIERKFVV